MHSATITSFLLAASGALAYPQTDSANTSSSITNYPQTETEVTILLQSQATETGSAFDFEEVNGRRELAVRSTVPFETLLVTVGADAQQDLRCQALGQDGNPLIATRGENVDITFSDSDNGEWTFVTPSVVTKLICDPAFVQASREDFEIRVILSSQRDGLATQTPFPAFNGRAESRPVGSSGPYDTVDIKVGALLDPTIRCKLIDRRGREIVATRGQNIDTTFSDGGEDANEWTFEEGRHRRVSNINCDEAFVANPQ